MTAKLLLFLSHLFADLGQSGKDNSKITLNLNLFPILTFVTAYYHAVKHLYKAPVLVFDHALEHLLESMLFALDTSF